MSNEAISSYIPEISAVNLPYNVWEGILTANNSNLSFKLFSQQLSILGIEYVVINKGPYVSGDSAFSFSGNVRLNATGFPWDLSYNPEGSWQNWTKLFSNDPDLRTVMKNKHWQVLQNTLYNGIIHVYLFPDKFNMSDIISTTAGGYILYRSSDNLIPLNFSIPVHNAFSNNWSKVTSENGDIFYDGGPLPSNMSYSNIWTLINLKNDSYYKLDYSITGKNMSKASIMVRFYSGTNMTGTVISTLASPNVSGNITNSSYSYTFKTPSEFCSSAIFLFYSSTPHVESYHYIFHINSFIFEAASKPLYKSVVKDYKILNPADIFINVNLTGDSTALILYSSSFNPDWNLMVGNFTYDSTSLSVVSNIEFNTFLIRGNASGAIISFKSQQSYSTYNKTVWALIILYGLTLSLTPLINQRRKRNER